MFARLALAASVLSLAACQSMTPPAAPAAPAAAAAPAPAWQQGRSADQARSTLAPVPGRMTVTPVGDIPVGKLKLPPGFKAEVWASGMPGARAMARSPSGKIYIGTRGIGRVYELTDNGSTRTSRVLVDKLVQPAGVAFGNGALYVMAIDKVLRFDGVDRNPGVAPVDMTAAFKLPPEQHHNWKYIAFGPDGKLYVPFGAPCNICEPRRRVRTDPPLQRRWVGHGSHRPRRAQLGRLRLAPGHQGAVVLRPWPRLDGRRRPRGRAEPRCLGGQELRLPVLPRQRRGRQGHQEGQPCAKA
jgi:glucose/arabinose dehydrogenase